MTRRPPDPDRAVVRMQAMGYRPPAPVYDPAQKHWWALAQDTSGHWWLVNLPDTLTEPELSAYDPTSDDSEVRSFNPRPPLGAFSQATDLIVAIIGRPRRTTVAAQWDRRAVNAYLDGLPIDERTALATWLAAAEPTGWATLEGLRCYDANLQVPGRQTEAVQLLKSTARRLWPRTMTAGRLTQFGRRHGDEVFMVLPYESWEDQAETALKRAAGDPWTTTGDTLLALVSTRPFDLGDLT